jgi:hypothetical protein
MLQSECAGKGSMRGGPISGRIKRLHDVCPQCKEKEKSFKRNGSVISLCDNLDCSLKIDTSNIGEWQII